MHFLFVLKYTNAYKCHIINFLLINKKFIIWHLYAFRGYNLACSVCTKKYRTSVFLYKPRPTGSVCTKITFGGFSWNLGKHRHSRVFQRPQIINTRPSDSCYILYIFCLWYEHEFSAKLNRKIIVLNTRNKLYG